MHFFFFFFLVKNYKSIKNVKKSYNDFDIQFQIDKILTKYQ